jgi:hypothetical protein
MKNIMNPLVPLLLILGLLSSCEESQMVKDAKKFADLQCKLRKLAPNVAEADKSRLEEYAKLDKEIKALTEEMTEKYKEAAMKLDYNKTVKKQMDLCK